MDLHNLEPIDTELPNNIKWMEKLQGNILSGHGRDFSVQLFIRLTDSAANNRRLVSELALGVTSARKQVIDKTRYSEHKIPGGLFMTVALSASGYRRLGFSKKELIAAFSIPSNLGEQSRSDFLDGMAAHAQSELGDPPPDEWEDGYARGDIDLMILLADDSEAFLMRRAGEIVESLNGRCDLACVERGAALRTAEGEGIEHFGFADGMSQPLFLKSDFLVNDDGSFQADRIDVWNPFEPLKLVLVEDKLARAQDSFGSFLVFRKLEQNVRGFLIAENMLADKLGLQGEDRRRAGAMVMGRFRDGTPLALSAMDGSKLPKENNFRYQTGNDEDELAGTRCPLHAHIRKTNPRGDPSGSANPSTEPERAHRIVRRGITYGSRNRQANAFQAIEDLPSGGIGLLFMCYQASISNQFAFIQGRWANSLDFPTSSQHHGNCSIVGLDPVIGQSSKDRPSGQRWPTQYEGGEFVDFDFNGFVTMRGGEYFFSPSIPFLLQLGNVEAVPSFNSQEKLHMATKQAGLPSVSSREAEWETPSPPENYQKDVAYELALECNQAEQLVPGRFLVVYGEKCYQLDLNSREFTFLFELHRTQQTFFWSAVAGTDGFIYCTLSGSATEPTPQGVASFGNWGGLFRVNHHFRELTNIGKFVDPFGIEFVEDGSLVVADFESWGPSGKIYSVQLATGEQQVLAEGGYLIDPQGVIRDGDGTLWIANAFHTEYDGSIVKVAPGNKQTVIYPRHGPRSGIVSGICRHSDNSKFICKVMDWPFMQTSRVLEIEKASGKVTPLLLASAANPKIYGNGCVVDGVLWIPESYRKVIIGFDLSSRKVVHEVDASPIAGNVKGIYDSFSFIESVSVVPTLNVGANSTTRMVLSEAESNGNQERAN